MIDDLTEMGFELPGLIVIVFFKYPLVGVSFKFSERPLAPRHSKMLLYEFSQFPIPGGTGPQISPPRPLIS